MPRIISRVKIRFFKKIIGSLPLLMAEHTFISMIFLFVLALFLGGLVYYQSKVSFSGPQDVSQDVLKFDQETYQRVQNVWQLKKDRFYQADYKEYPNPFE